MPFCLLLMMLVLYEIVNMSSHFSIVQWLLFLLLSLSSLWEDTPGQYKHPSLQRSLSLAHMDAFLNERQQSSTSTNWPLALYSKYSWLSSLNYLPIYFWFKIGNAYFLEITHKLLPSFITLEHKLFYIWPGGDFSSWASVFVTSSITLKHILTLWYNKMSLPHLVPILPQFLELLFPFSRRWRARCEAVSTVSLLLGGVASRPSCYLELCICVYNYIYTYALYNLPICHVNIYIRNMCTYFRNHEPTSIPSIIFHPPTHKIFIVFPSPYLNISSTIVRTLTPTISTYLLSCLIL